MKKIPLFEEFINESNLRFLNFKTKAQSLGVRIEWLDELSEIPQGLKEKVKLFGDTDPKDIAVIFANDNLKAFDKIKGLSAITIVYGEDKNVGQFAIINTKTA